MPREDERTQYIYMLHFSDKLSHAQHYVGSTENLRVRLEAHATGAGSNLCRVLYTRGIEWELGALGTCCLSRMRVFERKLKDLHNSPKYCTICNPDAPAMPYTESYPVGRVKCLRNSADIRTHLGFPSVPVVSVRLATPEDANNAGRMEWLRHTMQANKEALGFIPAGRTSGLTDSCRKGWVVLAFLLGRPIGYCAFTINNDQTTVSIQQVCVMDTYRGFGAGRMMVEHICQELHPTKRAIAKVREDLQANHFWQSIGFIAEIGLHHATSGAKLTHYYRPPHQYLIEGVQSNVV